MSPSKGEISRLQDEFAQRVDPRLRMIYNGDAAVNGLRAEASGVVAVTSGYRKGPEEDSPKLPNWTEPAEGIRVSGFLELDRPPDKPVTAPGLDADQRGRVVTAEFPLTQLAELARRPDVAYISSGEVLNTPNPITEPGWPTGPTVRTIEGRRQPQRDTVLLGFIDVDGFDFAHPDFQHRGHSRFYRIWDQGLPRRKGGGVPYGRQITRDQIDHALDGVDQFGLPATELLRQSVQVPGSHGTHVASIAGGNAGVCRTALLAGVTLSIPANQTEGRQSFFDSTRLADAVEYLLGLGPQAAKELGLATLPVVINISLGTNGHAHDGSSPINRWIDTALNEPGRCVVVAAGNAGQDRPHTDSDTGFLAGRIHTSGRVPASGLVADIEWDVLGNGSEDFSDNEMEIWFESQDRFSVSVKPPSSPTWIGPIPPGGYLQNRQLESKTFLSIYNERYLPANGANRISVFLSPRNREPVKGVEAGRWLVRLEGEDIHDGNFDAWIERDDVRPIRRLGDDNWGLPSLFSPASNVDRSSVNSLACGNRVTAVANLDPASEKTHPTSSQGPTRDGRPKPDLAAPGTAISAANGFSTPDRPWIAKTGTSMSSPYVAGVAALMLARDPRLTAAQILGMMRRTAQPLPGDTYKWSNSAGFGRITATKCLDEVAQVFTEIDLEKKKRKR